MSTPANTASKTSHKAMLNEETVPSPIPIKKKDRAIKATIASILQKTQKRIILYKDKRNCVSVIFKQKWHNEHGL